MVNNCFNKFIEQNAELLYNKIESVVNAREIGHDDNIKNMVTYFVDNYFRKYFIEAEIDVVCEIQREKSTSYPSNFCESKICKEIRIETIILPVTNC